MYHFQDLSNDNHSNRHMQQDYNQGHDFYWKILKEVKSSKNLDDEERAAIAYHNSFYEGYNSTPGGEYDQHKGRWDIHDRLPVSKYKPIKWTTCNQCQKEIINGYRFCPYCYGKLRTKNDKIKEPEDKGKWQTCPNCNRINFDNKKCYFCGEKLEINKTHFTKYPKKASPYRKLSKNEKNVLIKKENPIKQKSENENKDINIEKEIIVNEDMELIDAHNLYHDRDFVSAKNILNRILDKNPKEEHAHHLLERILYEEKENSRYLNYTNKLTFINKRKEDFPIDITNYKHMKYKYNGSENWFKFSRRLRYNNYVIQSLLSEHGNECAHCGKQLKKNNITIAYDDYDNLCTNQKELHVHYSKRNPDSTIAVGDCENCERMEECFSKLKLIHKHCKKKYYRSLRNKMRASKDTPKPDIIKLCRTDSKDMQLKYGNKKKWTDFKSRIVYNPHMRRKLIKIQNEKCDYCGEHLNMENSTIRIVDYDNVCTHKKFIKNPVKCIVKKIPDCENCERQNECVLKLIAIHENCNEKLKKILKEEKNETKNKFEIEE